MKEQNNTIESLTFLLDRSIAKKSHCIEKLTKNASYHLSWLAEDLYIADYKIAQINSLILRLTGKKTFFETSLHNSIEDRKQMIYNFCPEESSNAVSNLCANWKLKADKAILAALLDVWDAKYTPDYISE
jgi:hypothetical protein